MEDRVLALLVGVPILLIVLILGTMVFFTSDNGGPSNPIGAIPKVILDHVDGETVVTVMGVGKQRYDDIWINYSVGNRTFNLTGSNKYALDTNISAPTFVLNVTVLKDGDHYIYNCSVTVQAIPPEQTVLWITEEDEEVPDRNRSPFTALAEWRDIE
jgi:hypothetical protein